MQVGNTHATIRRELQDPGYDMVRARDVRCIETEPVLLDTGHAHCVTHLDGDLSLGFSRISVTELSPTREVRSATYNFHSLGRQSVMRPPMISAGNRSAQFGYTRYGGYSLLTVSQGLSQFTRREGFVRLRGTGYELAQLRDNGVLGFSNDAYYFLAPTNMALYPVLLFDISRSQAIPSVLNIGGNPLTLSWQPTGLHDGYIHYSTLSASTSPDGAGSVLVPISVHPGSENAWEAPVVSGDFFDFCSSVSGDVAYVGSESVVVRRADTTSTNRFTFPNERPGGSEWRGCRWLGDSLWMSGRLGTGDDAGFVGTITGNDSLSYRTIGVPVLGALGPEAVVGESQELMMARYLVNSSCWSDWRNLSLAVSPSESQRLNVSAEGASHLVLHSYSSDGSVNSGSVQYADSCPEPSPSPSASMTATPSMSPSQSSLPSVSPSETAVPSPLPSASIFPSESSVPSVPPLPPDALPTPIEPNTESSSVPVALISGLFVGVLLLLLIGALYRSVRRTAQRRLALPHTVPPSVPGPTRHRTVQPPPAPAPPRRTVIGTEFPPLYRTLDDCKDELDDPSTKPSYRVYGRRSTAVDMMVNSCAPLIDPGDLETVRELLQAHKPLLDCMVCAKIPSPSDNYAHLHAEIHDQMKVYHALLKLAQFDVLDPAVLQRLQTRIELFHPDHRVCKIEFDFDEWRLLVSRSESRVSYEVFAARPEEVNPDVNRHFHDLEDMHRLEKVPFGSASFDKHVARLLESTPPGVRRFVPTAFAKYRYANSSSGDFKDLKRTIEAQVHARESMIRPSETAGPAGQDESKDDGALPTQYLYHATSPDKMFSGDVNMLSMPGWICKSGNFGDGVYFGKVPQLSYCRSVMNTSEDFASGLLGRRLGFRSILEVKVHGEIYEDSRDSYECRQSLPPMSPSQKLVRALTSEHDGAYYYVPSALIEYPILPRKNTVILGLF